ncbi:MAG TPA: Mur ligase domain-containing protein [Roseiflexaceae bacterium]|nr:Mur ligase domain-containing protein [Roseiflexaceae bacterium]
MATHYHIVGIGGAGMSAIAHVLLDRGFVVSGSDMQHSALADTLVARGARIAIGHAAEYIADADVVLTTSAARPDHVELVAAAMAGIPILKRADLWRGWSHERAITAVAGTHGKTTTTALLALILRTPGRCRIWQPMPAGAVQTHRWLSKLMSMIAHFLHSRPISQL